MKINCIIIDDEPLARKGLKEYIADVDFLNLTGEFDNSLKATEAISSGEIQLLFLDIQMPKITGLDFFKTLHNAPPVIFTTAYPQYALESYELEAIDYLVKPIRIERFLKAVNKAESYYSLLQQEGNSNRVEKIEDDYVFIKADRKYFKIYFKDILYIEGLKDYVVIYTVDNKIITSMKDRKSVV